MDYFVLRVNGNDGEAEAEGSGRQSVNTPNEITEKLRSLKSLDMKALKVAIERELSSGKPNGIISLQGESSATRSKCWEYFSFVVEKGSGARLTADGKQYVACRACFRAYVYESAKGTSTLNGHTTRCSLQDANAGAGSMLRYTTPESVSAVDKRQVCRAAAIMCCKDLRTFSISEGNGFKVFAASLIMICAKSKSSVDVNALLPVGNTVKNYVVKVAQDARIRMEKLLLRHFNDGCSAGFTVDLWTDKARKLSFMSITGHWIDEFFKMHSRTLQVKHFKPKSHTATAVLDFFNDCLKAYNIYDSQFLTIVSDSPTNLNDRGLFTLVTDSGSNMSGRDGFRSLYDWIACADHKIAIILTTALCKTTETVNNTKSEPFYRFEMNAPKVFELIDSCKRLVRYVKQSNLQPELSKTLKQENVTRWGSHYRMMNSVKLMYDELATLLTARQKFSYLERIDRKLLNELVNFLDTISGCHINTRKLDKPTLHLVVYERYRLLDLLKPCTDAEVVSNEGSPDKVIPPDSASLLAIKQLILTHAMPPKNGN